MSDSNSTYAPKGTSLESFFADDPEIQKLLEEVERYSAEEEEEKAQDARIEDAEVDVSPQARASDAASSMEQLAGGVAGGHMGWSAVKPNPGIMPGAARILGKRLLGGALGGPVGAAALPAALDFMEDPKGKGAKLGETLGVNQAANRRKNLEAWRRAPEHLRKITGITAPGPKHGMREVMGEQFYAPNSPDWHF